MKLTIETIPHDAQRYDTCGDWLVAGTRGNPEITIKVSLMDDWRFEFLVGIHEAIEAALCLNDGVNEERVSAFDIAYEDQRKLQESRFSMDDDERITSDSEPGDHPDAPYQNQHNFATAVERMACAALGLKWADYEDAVSGLEWDKNTLA